MNGVRREMLREERITFKVEVFLKKKKNLTTDLAAKVINYRRFFSHKNKLQGFHS